MLARVTLDKKPKPLKTKADMLERIEYLEERIDIINREHASCLDDARKAIIERELNVYRAFAQGLLEAVMNGSKEGSFPRR